MANDSPPSGPRPTWAYAYEIAPPQPKERLRALKKMLARARREPGADPGWHARLVVETRVTHILVVSDTPAQDLAANQRLEAELRGLEIGYRLTAPMAVDDDPSDPPLVIPRPTGPDPTES